MSGQGQPGEEGQRGGGTKRKGDNNEKQLGEAGRPSHGGTRSLNFILLRESLKDFKKADSLLYMKLVDNKDLL